MSAAEPCRLASGPAAAYETRQVRSYACRASRKGCQQNKQARQVHEPPARP